MEVETSPVVILVSPLPRGQSEVILLKARAVAVIPGEILQVISAEQTLQSDTPKYFTG